MCSCLVANGGEEKAISCHSVATKSASFPHFGWHAPLRGFLLPGESLQNRTLQAQNGVNIYTGLEEPCQVSPPALASALLPEHFCAWPLL